MNINKVIFAGRLGKDPEIRYMQNGNAVANLTVAYSEKWTDKNTGEKVVKTEWANVIIFGKTAEYISENIVKGGRIYVEGKMRTRKWQDNNGNDRYTTEIVCDFGSVVHVIDYANDNQQQGQQRPQQRPQQSQPQAQNTPAKPEFDDDIPF